MEETQLKEEEMEEEGEAVGLRELQGLDQTLAKVQINLSAPHV